jgi:hypothetical protein
MRNVCKIFSIRTGQDGQFSGNGNKRRTNLSLTAKIEKTVKIYSKTVDKTSRTRIAWVYSSLLTAISLLACPRVFIWWLQSLITEMEVWKDSLGAKDITERTQDFQVHNDSHSWCRLMTWYCIGFKNDT